jgi:hypothetical protein
MKLPLEIKKPETATDFILLGVTGIFGMIVTAMIVMGYQEKKIPPEFKDTAIFIGGGIFGALSAKKLSG